MIDPGAASIKRGANRNGPQSSSQLAGEPSLKWLPREERWQAILLEFNGSHLLAIIALALLLLVGATGMFVTSTDLRPHAPTVGVAGSR